MCPSLVRVGGAVEVVIAIVAALTGAAVWAGLVAVVVPRVHRVRGRGARAAASPIGSCGCFGRVDTPPSLVHVVVNLGAAACAVGVAVRDGGGIVRRPRATSRWPGSRCSCSSRSGCTRRSPRSRSCRSSDASVSDASMSARLADRAAEFLGRHQPAELPAAHRDGRHRARRRARRLRAPARRLPTPRSVAAADSSCECGSLCCDGYTEFCCTMTGSNTCPPRHDRRRVVEGRRLAVLHRAALLHRLQRDVPVRHRGRSVPTSVPTPRGAAAARTATATTARPAAPSSATASATSRSRRSARSRAGWCRATPRSWWSATAPRPSRSTTRPQITTSPVCKRSARRTTWNTAWRWT